MRKLFLWLFIFAPILIISQTKNNPTFTISGKIIDAASKIPLEYATIVFKSLDSNKIMYGGITNAKGNFYIEVSKGSYNAVAEFISYRPQTILLDNLNKKRDLGTIGLNLDAEFLKEIEVTAQKSTLVLKGNKQIFNVGKDVMSNGGTATDILANIPSVDVDPNGSISLRGQDDVTVLINGKISPLSKSEVLKSLPAGSIEKVEVVTNPGAKYRASSKGIINIILKKEKNEGLNASITGTGGYKDLYGGLLTLNNKTKKINLFTTTSYFHRSPISKATYENTYLTNGEVTSYLNENVNTSQAANALLTTVGADFYISQKATLTTSVNYTKLNSENFSSTLSSILNSSKVIIGANRRINNGVYNDEIASGTISYEQLFEKEGQKLTADITFSNDKEWFNNNFTNTNLAFENNNYSQDNLLKNTYLNLTYASPINESAEFELGYNGEYGSVPFTQTILNSSTIIDYKEIYHSAYFLYAKQFKKLYVLAGIRGEFDQVDLTNSKLNSNLTKNYNNAFPSLSIDYTISDSKTLSFSYASRTVRPTYSYISPFEEQISPTNTFKGNENLNPIDVNSFQASYLYNTKNFTTQLTLAYQIWNNYWQFITYETGENVSGVNKLVSSYFNIGRLNYSYINLSTILKPTNWLQFTVNALLNKFETTGQFSILNSANQTITQNLDSKDYEGKLSLLTKISISNLFDLQTKIEYNSLSKSAISERKPYTYANLAISKDLFHKQATVSLMASDLFNSNKTNRTKFSDNYISHIISNNEPTVKLSFTYRFNQKKQDRAIDFEKKEIKRNF